MSGQASLPGAPPSLEEKVRFLSTPEAYDHGPETVEVIETSMSWVFLAGEHVFKMKKPVRRGALDFTTLKGRRAAVREELRLNRRLSPDVYHAARALSHGPEGALSLDGEGEVVEWLVHMRRLPEERTLASLIAAGGPAPEDVLGVADALADFYAKLPPVDLSAETYVAQFEEESRRTEATLTDPALKLDAPGLSGVLARFEACFRAARPGLEARVRQGRIVEGHGDLRPEHVFLTDPPRVIDCLEFSRSLRLVDPFDELVFLGMECAQLGAAWIARPLIRRMEEHLDDRVPTEVLRFYWRYRALLRARLALLHMAAPSPRTPEKWRPLARAYLAQSEKDDLMRRPRGDQ